MKIYTALLTALAGLASPAEAAITIDANSSLRKIDGFGFSQAFGRAKEFQTAPTGMQKQALDYLFSTTTGAGFSIIRNRIGSGGSGDSIEPNNPGSPSANPTYTWDNDDRGQVWFTKQAVAYGVKTIYADAWSAPGFMKTSGNEATAGSVIQSSRTCRGPATNGYAGIFAEAPDILAAPAIGGRPMPTFWCNMSNTTRKLASRLPILAS